MNIQSYFCAFCCNKVQIFKRLTILLDFLCWTLHMNLVKNCISFVHIYPKYTFFLPPKSDKTEFPVFTESIIILQIPATNYTRAI